MNRGYIKFWRKAQDSSSWNRGLMYQGLIINLLSRAAWKKASYQGRDLLPGQFGAVMGRLAESLGVPRSTLQRMVAHLEADDFLKVENMGNRFVVITIVNWHIYQESEKDAWAAGGQPTVNQRAAGGQPSYKEEEVKKEEEKNINTPPTPKGGNSEETLSTSPTPKSKTREPAGNSLSELRQAMADYTTSELLRKTLEDFRLMRERIRRPMTGQALRLLFRELEKLAGADDTLKIAILEQSILNSWQSVFALKVPARDGPMTPRTYAQAQDYDKRRQGAEALEIAKQLRGYDNGDDAGDLWADQAAQRSLPAGDIGAVHAGNGSGVGR